MACKYIYLGHTFNSEEALDDFLLYRNLYISEFGDLAFSAENRRLLEIASLMNDISKKSAEDKDISDAWHKAQRENNNIYDDDGDELINLNPYQGVNEFLSGLMFEDNKKLYPKFITKEFLENRKKLWKQGVFNDSEKELFEISDDLKSADITDEMCEKWGEKLVDKWNTQGRIGTAVHNVLQLYFTEIPSPADPSKKVRVFELPNYQEYIRDKILAKNKKYLLEDENMSAINDAIKYAENLKAKLEQEFGPNLLYYPEFLISGEGINSGKDIKLIGVIDLAVIDSSGKVHIIDYKTSVKKYEEFGPTKEISYMYLVHTYQRMLKKYGIDTYEGRMYLAPIQIKDFKYTDKDNFSYSGLDINHDLVQINNKMKSHNFDRMNQYMPLPFHINITPDLLETEHSDWMKKCFGDVSLDRSWDEKSVVKFLEKHDMFEVNDMGQYTFNKRGKEAPIIETDKTVFVLKVTQYLQGLKGKREQAVGNTKDALKQAIKKGVDAVDWMNQFGGGESYTWLQDTVKPYCNEQWEVLDNRDLEQRGLILLRNKLTNQLDIIRISSNNLTKNIRDFAKKDDIIKSRMGLTGRFEPDVAEASKSNSLMLEGVYGNVELMEIMSILNLSEGLDDCQIGKVLVVNPWSGNGLTASNEELLYCYNALNKFAPQIRNKFDEGKIKMCSYPELLLNRLMNILKTAEDREYKDIYHGVLGFKSSISALDLAIRGKNNEDVINQVTKLIYELENQSGSISGKLRQEYYNQGDLQQDFVIVHQTALLALALLKQINLRQQLKDHDKWIENMNIFTQGYSSTQMDNPGNLSSETLNLVTQLTTEAYQRTRDEMQVKKAKVLLLVKRLKESRHISAGYDNTVFNQADLYKDFIVEQDGDLLFRNLSDYLVGSAEYDFLKYVLEEINRDRFPATKTDELLKAMRDNYNVEYYRVPLCVGDMDSQVVTKGLLGMLKNKLGMWNPKVVWKKMRERAEGLYNATSDRKTQQSSEELFKMTNMFDLGNDPGLRLRLIAAEKKKYGATVFERNIETILLKHTFAYSQLRNILRVFPLIKASLVHLQQQGAEQNVKFEDDIQYLKNYISNKIKNQSIVDPRAESANAVLNTLKRAASITTLAFAPVQMIYQPLQGLFLDISLYIRKPNGQLMFSLTNFKEALSTVYKDLFHFSDKPTVCSLLNEIYGINDMDMNMYVDRISKAKKGIWNFENFAFKFASRPDYYNRMTLFVAKMKAEGCYDAHSISEDGTLKYDFKKDKRFEAFINKRYSDPEYNKQKQLYYAMARLFLSEHAVNADGSEFKFEYNDNNPIPLPKAYTNKEAESIKSLSDDIYGYYSHEKKSMIMSTTIGSMWLQFKTYWSGKKNQYLQSGGVRLRGKWEHYTEKDALGNDIKYYYEVDDQGNVRYDKKPKTEKEMQDANLPLTAPVMQWKGQWQEGILVTLTDIAKHAILDPHNIVQYAKNKYNGIGEDGKVNENLRDCYRNNIRQAGYDIFMFLLVGSFLGGLLAEWLKRLKDDNKKNKDLLVGAGIAAANVMVYSVKNATMDFDITDSIGSPLYNWDPFSFGWARREFKALSSAATGDSDIWDSLVNMSGATKQVKPLFDAIKPDRFRSKQEGGTWESATAKKNKE